MNIVDLIKSQIGGSVTDKLAGMLGVSPDKARDASGAAVPGLLAGLTSLASQPDGARKLDAAVDSADDSFASNPAAALSRLGEDGAETGSGILSSLFGGSMLSSLNGAIAKFSGLGGAATSGLLGMLAPMVLGILKKQKQTLGLDAGGLSSLLNSQKQNIAAAMPAGFSRMLGAIPGLSALTGAGEKASAAASNIADAGGDAWNRTRQEAASAYGNVRRDIREVPASTPRWVIPVALLVAFGALGWWLMSGPSAPPEHALMAPPAVQPMKASPSTPNLADSAETAKATLGDPSSAVTTQITTFVKSANDSLATIKDPASAEAALPKLKELSDEFDSIKSATTALPADSRTSVINSLRTASTGLTQTIDKLNAIPGVKDKIKPVLDELMTKINNLTGT